MPEMKSIADGIADDIDLGCCGGDLCQKGHTRRLQEAISQALLLARKEGGEAVVAAVEGACGVGASFARSKDWTIGFDDARELTVGSARSALTKL